MKLMSGKVKCLKVTVRRINCHESKKKVIITRINCRESKKSQKVTPHGWIPKEVLSENPLVSLDFFFFSNFKTYSWFCLLPLYTET